MSTATDQRENPSDTDPRDPSARLERLVDPGTLDPLHERDDSGVLTARGRVDGTRVVTYCSDGTRMGGAMGSAGCGRIVEAIDLAVRERCPVIGVWHSGGARLPEGVLSLDGMGRMFSAMIRASGRVPQISVIVGPAAGGAVYGPALTDVVVMSPSGKMFVTGPEVVRSVTGEEIDMEGLGGTDAHGGKSGVVHLVADDESDAYARARRVTGLLARPGEFAPRTTAERPELKALLPDRPQRAYDTHPIISHILDDDGTGRNGFEEFQPRWAPNMITGLGRLAGRSVGVLANNPIRLGGCLDSLSAEKAARFVRLCDCFGVPLVVLVDVPGYLPGVSQEWNGVVRRGAKLLHAFGEAVVPRATLVLRKSYGGAYIAMNSRALGADHVLAWPEAEIAVMGAKAAVGVLHRKRLAAAPEEEREALRDELAAEHERASGGVERAVELGFVDEIVDPAESRRRLAEVLAAVPERSGTHSNIPL
ncbi:acetyl-CoA/propionyl-CoA carboxylase carboxyl transferase subunit [Actinopolyspora alba]|uniref:Acetyl-CoA/propionyl-CoA carboxylase carboxyl transferase subunit n=1 Tax=Actinopolyspora alba TaxID=673379 RepID=A0A1I1UV94_9ACTN|nr:carboxyl transferase domain-containing protein [Actinopolyspora alba]SFD72773.1 acetyl-CoA/propionyl-CoA carboxylase carboxyl transferase subunit [Actinopolyspora alba]